MFDEEPDETLDPETPAADSETVVEPEAPKGEAASTEDAFTRLGQRVTAAFSDSGGIPEADAERVLGALSDEAIRKMPAEAQVALRAIPEVVTRSTAAAQSKLDQERQALVAERAKFDAERKALIRQQRELADLVGSDAMRALMAKATPAASDEEPDLLTPDGQAAHIERQVARGLASVLRPLAETSEATRRQSIWNEFIDENAVLHDDKARTRFIEVVGQIVAERAIKNDKGEVVQKGIVPQTEWPRILQQVQAEQIVQRDQARRAAEVQARAAAAAKVSRPTRTATAAPQLPTGFDQWPARERAAYFQAHPDIYTAVRRHTAA